MIRDYRLEDTEILIALFRGTVRDVNLGDYTDEQVVAWAPEEIDAAVWAKRQARNDTFVAEIDGDAVGFAELQDGKHLHMLFVHKSHQSRGIATALLTRLEAIAHQSGAEDLTADVSITARPFFTRRGFTLIAPRTVILRGQEFQNFQMSKAL